MFGGFLKVKRYFVICTLLPSILFPDLQDRATPWTPSYLTASSEFAVDRFSGDSGGSSKNQCRYSLKASPLIDWGVDASFMASSIKTPKIALRAERQILCDLTGDPFSATLVASGSLTTLNRAKNPLFFEMSAKTLQAGVGLGRHLFNEKTYYTQIFSYLIGGIGSGAARFATAEVGLQHVYMKRHRFLASVEYLHASPFSHHQRAGIATREGRALSLGLWYTYQFDSGIAASVGYIKREIHSPLIRSATLVQVQLSLPIVF
jgi:hypothetical protein